MTRRGDELREHILWIAKTVFLEAGFERASMDVVAARAGASKRSVYAHFESKEKLFLAVIELVRGLFLGKVKRPEDYADDPAEALTRFCGRYVEMLTYRGAIQMSRLTVAETARFPEAAAHYFDLMFAQVAERLAAYLASKFALDPARAQAAAQRLLGQVLYPRYPRTLYGLDPVIETFDPEALAPDFDLTAIATAVDLMLASLEERR
jgi:AcrR family transcriptional regulator